MQLVPRLLDLEKVFTPPTENKKTEEMIDYIRTLRKPDRTWLELSPDKRSSEFKVQEPSEKYKAILTGLLKDNLNVSPKSKLDFLQLYTDNMGTKDSLEKLL